MKRSLAVVLGVALVLGCSGLLTGCEEDSGEGSGGKTLTNPVIPPGGGRDEKVRWQNYEGEPTHQGRLTAIKWPASLMSQYGCTPENTKCVVDGTTFPFYAVDVYPSGAQILSYGCSTRADTEFPAPFVAILYRNGEPFAACQFPDPMIDNDLQDLPPTIVLPGWAD